MEQFKLTDYSLDWRTIQVKKNSFHDQTQRVVIEVLCSTGRLVMREVLQGSVLGPLPFNIFINDL